MNLLEDLSSLNPFLEVMWYHVIFYGFYFYSLSMKSFAVCSSN